MPLFEDDPARRMPDWGPSPSQGCIIAIGSIALAFFACSGGYAVSSVTGTGVGILIGLVMTVLAVGGSFYGAWVFVTGIVRALETRRSRGRDR